MTKYPRNDVGSLVVDRVPTTDNAGCHFRLFTAFSGSAFCRKIFEAVSCGGSSRYGHSDNSDDLTSLSTSTTGNRPSAVENSNDEPPQKQNSMHTRSEKLCDLLKLAALPEPKTDLETKKMKEKLDELKSAVKDVQIEDLVRRKMAASKARWFAKEDVKARETLSMLGAIPPLVEMLDLEGDDEFLIASLYALLNLGIRDDANKAAIVKAGAIHKMIKLIKSNNAPNSTVSEAIIANFLSLSALDSNKPIIGLSGAISFLVKTLQNFSNTGYSQSKQDALRALYNLSTFPSNIPLILESDLIPFILNSLGDMEVSEKTLSILSYVVSTAGGRKAISIAPDAYPILVDVLNWIDSGCQEKASYVLMIMAHKVYSDRHVMIEAGVVSASLELTLLGSALTQKRASRILECLRVDKRKQVSANFGGNSGVNMSAPIYGSSLSSDPNLGSRDRLEELGDMMSEEKKAVKQLVQQSLQKNMRRIVKRANLPQDFVPSEQFKSLTSSSTSKSLPFRGTARRSEEKK